MKIALVTPYDYPFPGGVTEHIRHLDREFRARGHETRIIAPSSEPSSKLEPNVIRVSDELQTLTVNGSTAHIALAPSVVRQVAQALAREHFDVVHLHEPAVPLVCLAALCCSCAVNVGTFHGLNERNILFRQGLAFMKWLYSRLHGHIFVSGALRDSVTRYLPGEFRVIPNGVDCRHFGSPEIQKIAEFDDGRPNILFVGRLDERKGFRTLLGAFEQVHARVPAARLLVVGAFGEGEASQFAGQIPADLRQDVHLIGRVSREALPRYYRSATLFCAPSIGGESFGIVLLEAMAAGAPVVASDIPGYRSVIENDRQGCLVPPGDKEALACSLIQLLQDAGRRAEMAAEGQATAERYDWKLVAPRVLDYYEDLISRRTAIEADRAHARGYRANGLNDFHGRVLEWVKRYAPFTRPTMVQNNSPRAAR